MSDRCMVGIGKKTEKEDYYFKKTKIFHTKYDPEMIRVGDIVAITSLHFLGKSVKEVTEVFNRFARDDIQLLLNGKIYAGDELTYGGNLLVEWSKATKQERMRHAREHKRTCKGGRPIKLNAEDHTKAIKFWLDRGLSNQEIADSLIRKFDTIKDVSTETVRVFIIKNNLK